MEGSDAAAISASSEASDTSRKWPYCDWIRRMKEGISCELSSSVSVGHGRRESFSGGWDMAEGGERWM